MRTIVDLPEEQIRALDVYSRKHGSPEQRLFGGPWRCFCPNADSADLIFGITRGSAPGRIAISIRSIQGKLRAEWDDRA